jgi:hypothetical protein
MDGVEEGVLPMRKSLTAELEVFVSEKKVDCELSGLAFTVIVKPPAGIVEVIDILTGKVGPGAGGSVELFAGVVEICKACSPEHVPESFFFLQYGITKRTSKMGNRIKRVFFIFCLLPSPRGKLS